MIKFNRKIKKSIHLAGILFLVFVMVFALMNFNVNANTQMVVPNATPTISASTWMDIQNAVSATPTGNVLIEITSDITADSGAITIPAGRNVFLRSNSSSSNVYSLYQDNLGEHHFFVDGGELSIGNITLTRTTPTGLWFESGGIAVQNSGNLEMFAGAVINGNESNAGGVFIKGGTFTMHDGVIKNNENVDWATGGGGVLVYNGLFTMHGGEISDNTSFEKGGGVCIINDSTFNMHGGIISGNTTMTGSGGGVAVSSSSFTMSGGTISDNTAKSLHGGGIYNANLGSITISGGIIINNTALEMHGGGIYNAWGSSLTITGGEIVKNSASIGNGGGIFAMSYDDLTIGENVIFIGNTASLSHDWFLSPNFLIDPLNVPASESGFGWGGNIANIEWHSISIAGTHLLNNYDINFNGHSIHYQVVTFNSNGGTFVNTPLSQLQANGQSQWRWISQVADTGTPDPTYSLGFDEDGKLENLSLPYPTRPNYTFDGWFDSQANANGTTEDGRVLDTDIVTEHENITLWARWTRKMVDVTFKPGINGSLTGGTPNIVISVPYGTVLTIADIPNVIPNTEWKHIGWDLTNPIGFIVTESVTFTALYELDETEEDKDKINSGSPPNTGDSTNIWRYITLMIGGLFLMTVTILLEIKNSRRQGVR